MIDNKLGKDYKDKRVNSKSQAFIWRIDNKGIVVGPLKDQEAVGVVVRDWSVAGLEMQMLIRRCRSWSGDAGPDQVIQELVW